MYLKSQPNSTNDFEKNSAIRLSQENRWVILAQIIPWSEFEKDYAQNFTEKKEKNRGKLILDATCTPADIKYPTDLGLLNEAREHTEKVIDKLYKTQKSKLKAKPRTYRKQARQGTEFGAKLSASSDNGFVFLDHISWDNFNESKDLIAQVEAFKSHTGSYPESVHVDKIYRKARKSKLV